jgi:signal transduction histidine kinase
VAFGKKLISAAGNYNRFGHPLEITHDLAAMPDFSILLEGALRQLRKVVDFQRAALMLVEEDGESLTIHAYLAPALPPSFTLQHVPINRWPRLQTTLQGGETTYISDMQASEAIMAELDRLPAGPWTAALKASRSWLGLPLVSGERRIGLLNILGDEANHYDASDIKLARTYANQLAVAVDNIYLKDQAGLTAAAEERSRIARDLHDSVTQALYSMTLLSDATILALTAGKLEAVEERLARIKDVARDAMTEMRWLVYNLHPSVLADAGLAAALQQRLGAVEARSGVKVDFQVNGQSRLPPASERELYWVAQEGLNNVLRHARASQVWVTIDYEESRCRLTIRDDGVGFRLDAAGRSGGYGLTNMRDRLAQINGTLKINTELSKGTTLEIEVDQ